MNEPQLSAEMEKRFDEALGVGTYGKIVSFDDIKHFLATALEEQRDEYVRKVEALPREMGEYATIQKQYIVYLFDVLAILNGKEL